MKDSPIKPSSFGASRTLSFGPGPRKHRSSSRKHLSSSRNRIAHGTEAGTCCIAHPPPSRRQQQKCDGKEKQQTTKNKRISK
eukprot:scaffold4635_cov267-Pinguiococcus_pyrenoidosus.AAC.15